MKLLYKKLNSNIMMRSNSIVLLLILTGCASYDYPTSQPAEVEDRSVLNQPKPEDTETYRTDDIATPLEDQQFNRQRAEHFETLSANSPEQKTDSQLSSAEYYIQAGDYAGASQLIDSLETVSLNKQQQHRLTIIQAYLDYAKQEYRVSLNRLNRLLLTPSDPLVSGSLSKQPLSQQQRVDALLLSSFNYKALGDSAGAITQLIEREQYLGGTARAENARYTWQLINDLSDQERQSILSSTQDPRLRNRLEQSTYQNYTRSASQPQQFDQWRNDLSDQPKQDLASQWQASSPRHIAVLLPLNSKFSKAAQAVYDGIQYQHNLNGSPFKPKLDVYDIGAEPSQVHRYYFAAQQSGADFIIGPLGTSFADQLSYSLNQYDALPTILLGGNADLSRQNVTRLSMSPEQEGIQIAQKAFADGHINAALLFANSATSQRTATAFQQYWLERGGRISQTIQYSTAQYDHSTEIKQLFDISNSEYRRRRLAATLGFRPKFSAYRRQDIDFIFMIANDATGRIIRPQINFYEGRNIPVFATSSIYNGVQDEINNMDLDNIQFPTQPWVFESSQTSQYAGQLNTLYALGIDAYSLAASFKQLRSDTNLSIEGKLGKLHIEPTGNIIQRPIWASFKDGLAVTNANYTLLLPESVPEDDIMGADNLKNERNQYDESNWDAGSARRKTGTQVPAGARP